MGIQGLVERGVPPQPPFVIYIRYAILVLSLICLALGAWAVSISGGSYGYIYSGGAGGLIIFVVCESRFCLWSTNQLLTHRAADNLDVPRLWQRHGHRAVCAPHVLPDHLPHRLHLLCHLLAVGLGLVRQPGRVLARYLL